MARLQSPTLFFTTSPRTPSKMIPEIKLLVDNFEGQEWNPKLQAQYAQLLSKDKNFGGAGSKGNMDFSARDRITRAPKALGFVDLKPVIKLTEPGKQFVYGNRTEEILLRQLLKFQLPSPYHKEPKRFEGDFCVKPYLELLRLIYDLGTLSFDELMIYGMQITHYDKYNEVLQEIRNFRRTKTQGKVSYKVFRSSCIKGEIERIFEEDIRRGQIKTRESDEKSLDKFIGTKARTLRDYTDACFRYLRATGLVEISQRRHSLSITPEKKKEVEYILNNIDRNPVYVNDEAKYKEYLFDASLPVLYSDDKNRLICQISEMTDSVEDLAEYTVEQLKDTLYEMLRNKKEKILEQQVKELKEFKKYNDVMTTFDDIKNNALYDAPLMLEWNTWRAITMMDGGEIIANLKMDDKGQPMSTAQGNIADIVCDYGEFGLTVEVTMQSGQRQYEMEGEPVARHLAKLKKETGKDAYCLFVAPKINEACIAHFYTLHSLNVSYYGGKSVIVPLELDVFINMVEQSYRAEYTPNSEQVKKFFEYSHEQAKIATDEVEWYEKVKSKALDWL